MEDPIINLEELDTIENNAQEKLQVKNRYKDLSEKVITTAKERDDALAQQKADTAARLKAEKELSFYKDFSQVSAQHPQAAAYQDKILEKVNSGYSTEDATLAVLAKEGKLQPISAQTQSYRPDNVAGGSASTAMSDTGDKRPEEMTREELRNALLDAEKGGLNILKF